MLHLNVNKNVKIIDKNNSCIITDFDHTLTKPNSKTIWGIISDNPFVPDEYNQECKKNFDYFRTLELSNILKIDDKKRFMDEWVKRHIELFKKYHISLDTLNKIILNENDIFLRNDIKKFLFDMYNNNIPVVIISSGFKYMIELYLAKNKCYYKNITVISNEFETERGIISNIITPYINSANKGDINLDFIKKEKGISFGDQLEDLNMGSNLDLCRVAFLNNHDESFSIFRNKFDILLTGDSSVSDVTKLLIKDYKK